MAYYRPVNERLPLNLPSLLQGDLAPRPAQSPVCGNLSCPGGWMQRWKNRRRPFFEGKWACSRTCLSILITESVQREMGSSLAAVEAAPHRHRVPLGLVLMSQGAITHAQLQQALDHQRSTGGGRIGEILMQTAGLNECSITRALGVQWNSPMLTLEGFSPEKMARIAPAAVLDQTGMLPVRLAGGRVLYIGFETELNPAAALALEQMTGLQVHSGLLPSSKFRAARQSLNEVLPASSTEKQVQDQDALVKAMCNVVEKQQPVATRLTRVNNLYWMRLWLEAHEDDRLDYVWDFRS